MTILKNTFSLILFFITFLYGIYLQASEQSLIAFAEKNEILNYLLQGLSPLKIDKALSSMASTPTSSLNTTLIISAHTGDQKLVQLALENVQKHHTPEVVSNYINTKNRKGCDALMYAAQGNHTSVVTLLCDARAEVTHVDNEGCTAFIHAVARDSLETAQYLLKRDTTLMFKKDNAGLDPLSIAYVSDAHRCLSWLVKQGASLDTIKKNKWYLDCMKNPAKIFSETFAKLVRSALLASNTRILTLQVAQECLTAGANINAVDEHGLTPLVYADNFEDKEIKQWLIDRGASTTFLEKFRADELHAIADHELRLTARLGGARATSGYYIVDEPWRVNAS